MGQAERLAAWMRERLVQASARGLVVGLSGGVDSAVVARLAQLASPGAVLAVLMPCHGDPQDERDAMLVASHFSLPTVRIDLARPYDELAGAVRGAIQALPPTMHRALLQESGGPCPPDTRREDPERPASADPRSRAPLANMKPRIRMTALYFIANSLNYLVAGTGNRSELAIGYFTKYGDGGVDLLPLANLVKHDVRTLARELGVPPPIVDRTPTAGLWLGQTDEAEMGFSYADLERYLHEGAEGVAPAVAMRIERLIRASDHKRQVPPSPPI